MPQVQGYHRPPAWMANLAPLQTILNAAKLALSKRHNLQQPTGPVASHAPTGTRIPPTTHLRWQASTLPPQGLCASCPRCLLPDGRWPCSLTSLRSSQLASPGQISLRVPLSPLVLLVCLCNTYRHLNSAFPHRRQTAGFPRAGSAASPVPGAVSVQKRHSVQVWGA